MAGQGATERFSDRVPYYHAYRPRYPAAIITLMMERLGLTETAIVADVGAGTGILSELFLKNGNTVYAVEPNTEMRAAAEDYYGEYLNFAPVAGTAEATSLEDASVDFIVAGQAFHWFDKNATKPEFQRILKPGGAVVLLWNIRKEDSSPFQLAYDALLRDFDQDGNSQAAKGTQHGGHGELDQFFGAGQYEVATFDNEQTFDFDGLCGRLLSASYMPLPGHPRYDALIEQAQAAFETYQQNGQVRLDYVTEVYWGQLD